MSVGKMSSLRSVFAVLVVGILAPSVIAEMLYVDSRNGNDTNPGTEQKPLKTIGKAAVIVNGKQEAGPTTIKIGQGVYNLTKAVVFENTRPYTRKDRFIIEATILPDDPQWKPTLMPVILSTEDYPGDEYGKYTYVFKIEMNHVTVRGLKFLGNPVPHNMHFPICRLGQDKEDLIVTQCLFVGDVDALPIHVPITANGHELVVDHCIFYKCKNSVVFCDAKDGKSKKNAMRYCIVDGNYSTGVWTYGTDEDFEFHNNIITRCLYTWMRGRGNQRKYKVNDCIITDNKYHSGYGLKTGEYTQTGRYIQTGPEITYEEKNIIKHGKVVLEKGQMTKDEALEMPRNYLHPLPGTLGSDLGAGLFIRPSQDKSAQEPSFSKKTYTYKKVDRHEILADVYRPKKNKIRPVVVYIHGWYMADSRHNLMEGWKPLLDKLIEADYAVVSIDFRLAPEAKLEQMMEDVRDACVWVREKGPKLFNVDPNKVAVIGGSSGGSFAFTTGYTVKPAPQVVVAVSGPGDLSWAGESNGDKSILKKKEKPYDIVGDTVITVGTHSDRYKLWPYLTEKGLYLWELLGFEPELKPDRFNALLPIKNFTSNYPPTLLIYSEGETYANVKEHLDAKQIENDRLVVPEGHSSQIIRGYPEAVERIVSFLNKHLK